MVEKSCSDGKTDEQRSCYLPQKQEKSRIEAPLK